MKFEHIGNKLLFSLIILIAAFNLCGQDSDSLKVETKQVTFLEFGSTTCVPCKMMEKVLEEIKDIYGESIEVKFINVMKEREMAKEYNIKLIPTQIFFDAQGNEILRHQGYFPTTEIQKVIDPYIDKEINSRQ